MVAAALALPDPPLFVYASSAAVYGSRNPHRHPERITAETPINPADQYGEDKVRVRAESSPTADCPMPCCDWVASSPRTAWRVRAPSTWF